MRYYAGIGSRTTPYHVQAVMSGLGLALARMGWVLRSGGATGADDAFERGAMEAWNKRTFEEIAQGLIHFPEIWLPYKKFNGHDSPHYNLSDEAYRSVNKFHPAPQNLNDVGIKLMARNWHQIHGYGPPVEFVVCWTPEGRDGGGTRQALEIARAIQIPTFNLYEDPAGLCEAILGFAANL